MSAINGPKIDPMKVVYLRCDLVSQLSCLTLVLRAAPPSMDVHGLITDDCVMAAREAFNVHEQAMGLVRGLSGGAAQVTKYLNW
jgi:hypothetical protein